MIEASVTPPAAPASPSPAPTTAAAPAKGPPPIPSTAELLAEAEKAAPTATPVSSPASPAVPAAPAEPSTSPTDAAQKEPKPAANDSALARLAREQRRLDAQRKQVEDERKQLHGAAAEAEAHRALKARLAKGGKERAAAIRELVGAEQFDAAYFELTDEILESRRDKTDEEKLADKVRADVEAGLAAKREAEVAAAKKAKDEADAAEQAQLDEWTGNFLSGINEHLTANQAKYPAIVRAVTAMAKRGKEAVSAADILSFSESHFKAHGKPPTQDEVLGHFEADLSEIFAPPETKPTGTVTVTSGWTNDAPMRPLKELSMKEIHEEALRAANISR